MTPVASLLSLVTAAVTVASPAAGFSVLTPATSMRQSSAKHHGEQQSASSTRPSTGNIGYGKCDASLPSRAGVISNLHMSGARSSSEQAESPSTGSPARSRVSVSRAFNRALGTILSTGDMFGSVGGGGGVGLDGSSFRQKRLRRNKNGQFNSCESGGLFGNGSKSKFKCNVDNLFDNMSKSVVKLSKYPRVLTVSSIPICYCWYFS